MVQVPPPTIVDGGGRLPTDTNGTTGIAEQIIQVLIRRPQPHRPSGRSTLQGGGGDTHNVYSLGSNLTISRCVLTGRLGAFYNIQGGSTISYPSILTIDQSTISGSRAGIFNDGSNTGTGLAPGSNLKLTNSTIINTNDYDYGVYFNGTATITNTTITGTAFGLASAPTQGNIARVSHTTFHQNRIDIYPVIGATYLKNSILASLTPCDTAAFTITSLGKNLYGPNRSNSCGSLGMEDRILPDIALFKLEALGYDSGLAAFITPTFRLLPGSTAIDTGTCLDTLGAIVATDQRGVVRPQDGNGNGTFTATSVPTKPVRLRPPATPRPCLACNSVPQQSSALAQQPATYSTISSHLNAT